MILLAIEFCETEADESSRVKEEKLEVGGRGQWKERLAAAEKRGIGWWWGS